MKWYAVNYGGIWKIQEEPYYESPDILDVDNVGKKEARANAKLASNAPEMLEMLKRISEARKNGTEVPVMEIEKLIKQATEP